MNKKYVLESASEFGRLERQSATPEYDFKRELGAFKFKPGDKILDAGCGSGIVSRYIATENPYCEVLGCDLSEDRISQANMAAYGISNLQFQVSDLSSDQIGESKFDYIISRYVFHHIPSDAHEGILKQLVSALKPRGQLILIDLDGFLYNIHPQSELIASALSAIEQHSPVDLRIGRKLPYLFAKLGLEDLSSEIQTLHFTGESMTREIRMMEERLTQALESISMIVGGKDKAREFRDAYLKLMREPGTTLFYNKFVVSGRRPGLKLVG